MIIDRPQAKQAAKNCMRTARISPYQIGLVYILITFALSAFDQFMTMTFGVEYYLDAYTTFLMPSGINWFITILVSLIGIILQAGFVTYCLAVRCGKEMPLTTLFDGFSLAGKLILLNIVMSIFIFLWSLLFVIPGIIACYRYRFALYNLLENPDLGIMEVIGMSKEQTRGYKWQLFMLDLSFLGWLLLDVCTMGFLGIWLIPYMTLTDIAFYDTICAQKGITASGQSGWHQGAPEDAPGQYDYDWNHQNSSWNAAPRQTDVPSAPEESQPTTPPSLGTGDAPAAPEPPTPPADDPWKNFKDNDPWKRFDNDKN